MITHEWDETDVEAQLEEAFQEYRRACYGNAALPDVQLKEVRQAFLSGIHWLNTQESYCPDETTAALRNLLKGSFPAT